MSGDLRPLPPVVLPEFFIRSPAREMARKLGARLVAEDETMTPPPAAILVKLHYEPFESDEEGRSKYEREMEIADEQDDNERVLELETFLSNNGQSFRYFFKWMDPDTWITSEEIGGRNGTVDWFETFLLELGNCVNGQLLGSGWRLTSITVGHRDRGFLTNQPVPYNAVEQGFYLKQYASRVGAQLSFLALSLDIPLSKLPTGRRGCM